MQCKNRSVRTFQLCWYLFSDHFSRVRVCFCYLFDIQHLNMRAAFRLCRCLASVKFDRAERFAIYLSNDCTQPTEQTKRWRMVRIQNEVRNACKQSNELKTLSWLYSRIHTQLQQNLHVDMAHRHTNTTNTISSKEHLKMFLLRIE